MEDPEVGAAIAAGDPAGLAAPWHRVLRHPYATVAGAAASVMAAGVIAAGVIAGQHHGSPSGAGGGNGLAPSGLTRGTTPPVAFQSPGAPSTPGGTPNNAPLPPGSSSSSSAPSPASVGTVSVSTGRLVLVAVNGTAAGTFTLTANGGPVSYYSITVGSMLAGSLTVSPSSGSLASGASVTITVSSKSLIALDGQLTVKPGGQMITVVFTIGL